MDQYRVLGNPIHQSKSPNIHQAFAAATNQPLNYQAQLVAEKDFEHTVRQFFVAGGKGLNITVPFKQRAFAMAQVHSPAAAKAEGMIVEVFTVLDPDTMIAVAESGVDYIETDMPIVMEMVQPPRESQASNPQPMNEEADVLGNPLLSWTLAMGDVQSHKIHLGTTDPPPFLVETTADMHRTDLLEAGTTYFWKVDTVTKNGTVKGKVWQFTTAKSAVDGNLTEWHLNGTLGSVAGDSVLNFNTSTAPIIKW
ncbi:MAG: hypothetical protein HN804_05260, partial [Oceanospirillaceae bacterium]|nr:hypothetical protein [Oceanospirillaceae bacterium]